MFQQNRRFLKYFAAQPNNISQLINQIPSVQSNENEMLRQCAGMKGEMREMDVLVEELDAYMRECSVGETVYW